MMQICRIPPSIKFLLNRLQPYPPSLSRHALSWFFLSRSQALRMIVNSQVDAKLPHKKENGLNEVSEEVGPCVSYAIISR